VSQSTGGPKCAYRLRVQAPTLSHDAKTPPTEEDRLDERAGGEGDVATWVWLVSALEHTSAQRQSKISDYLEAIAHDLVFEAEMAARRASLLSGVG
jgi:hypothetical protein